MVERGRAVAYGAVTIVNAISCGLGAALGVRLKTEAEVRLTNEPGRIVGRILSDPEESTILIESVVNRVLEHFGLKDEYGAYVETTSNIPIARGLKSSSAAANAIALATVSALGETIDDVTLVNLGVDAAIDAKVTITGAFDDACASYFGDIVITENMSRRILKRVKAEDYTVLIHVPPEKSYTAKSDVKRMKLIAKEVASVHGIALRGEHWQAMTINGILYSSVLGYDTSIVIEALSAGAIASGLSGKGPAVASIVPEDAVDHVLEVLERWGGEIIKTEINHEKAHRLV
ncbi:shikimate kinase [Candidatus Bathyarchaeota archaeon]|nr:MAG: shikimate kinase [Candidatus Bathyarchaeota archaeon ex4484_40]RJS67677.1 MAG: shikimate kinase [Candidatus Bathyarchaeota archaeon]RJS78835.1 MAG: shikimate kinase [Candidatus Bathyarchaeota archaeon]RLG98640.1 MAG: shikimate kinase [Candidatus Bathyarchaeota archaeon]